MIQATETEFERLVKICHQHHQNELKLVSPNFGQPGGLPEYQFPTGTGSGTVSPSISIP
jgi:hypothetical protein